MSDIKFLKGNLLKPSEWCWRPIKPPLTFLSLFTPVEEWSVVWGKLSFAWWLVLTASQGSLAGTGTRHGKPRVGWMLCYGQHSPRFMSRGSLWSWSFASPLALIQDSGKLPSILWSPRQWECLMQCQFKDSRWKDRYEKWLFVSVWDRVVSCDQSIQVETTLVSQHASTFALS